MIGLRAIYSTNEVDPANRYSGSRCLAGVLKAALVSVNCCRFDKHLEKALCTKPANIV